MRNNYAFSPFQLSHPHQEPAVFFRQRRKILAVKTRLAPRQPGFNTLENGLAYRRTGGDDVAAVIKIIVPDLPNDEHTIRMLSDEFRPDIVCLQDNPVF